MKKRKNTPLSAWEKTRKWAHRASISLWLPILLLILFFTLTVAAFVYQKNTATQRDAGRTLADLRATASQLDGHLLEQRLALTAMAEKALAAPEDFSHFEAQAQQIISRYPELYAVHLLDDQGSILAGFSSPAMVNSLLYANGDRLEAGKAHTNTLAWLRDSSIPAYSPVILYGEALDTVSTRALNYGQSPAIQLLIPIQIQQPQPQPQPQPEKQQLGKNSTAANTERAPDTTDTADTSATSDTAPARTAADTASPAGGSRRYLLLAEYAIDGLYRYALSDDMAGRYATAFTDASGLAYTGSIVIPDPQQSSWSKLLSRLARDTIPTQRSPIAGLDGRLHLQVQNFHRNTGHTENLIWLAITALGILMTWIMAASWRHNRWRARTQRVLQRETAFRRAIEQSMLTGLRVIDMEKRITHVNAAFCEMTGYSQQELINTRPPYPYWPASMHERLSRQINRQLDNMPAGGYPIQLQRKNGELFDGFLYISPLIDGEGKQAGWVTSLTDITESNRIKSELSQAHERFAKVLNSMDSSVSVASVATGDLLFSNRIYQQWFGPDQYGMAHNQLISLMPQVSQEDYRASQYDDGGVHVENAEVYGEEWGKWLNLQTRPLRWTDGSAAIMLLATDVSVRKNAQEINASNMAKLQANSHLVTMGEMASSVAHELNQPLTAISNYGSGILKRMDSGSLSQEALTSALQKIGKQAERAGNIIRRIREFIKRSEPKRTETDVTSLLNDTRELVEMDMIHRRCQLSVHADSELPRLLIDPLLIQQVLVNLIKNAGEAIDRTTSNRKSGHRAAPRRISVRADSDTLQGRPAISFSVQDTGPGIAEEVRARLFDAFYSTKTEGMGIGLNLCRSIVEAHMGKIEAENLYNDSQEVTGCTFRFTLPLAGNTSDPVFMAEAASILPPPFEPNGDDSSSDSNTNDNNISDSNISSRADGSTA